MSRVVQNLNKRRLFARRRLRDAGRAPHAVPAGEELYRSIVAALSEGILMENASGEIIECNAAAERILGLSRDQILGLTGLDPRWQMTDADGVPAGDDNIPSRMTTRTGQPQHDVIMTVRRADDSRAWLLVNTQPLLEDAETGRYSVVASFADITELRRAEAVLRENEARFRSLFEHSIEGILLVTSDGRILAANPEACGLLGRSGTELCALTRGDIVDAIDPRLPAYLEVQARTGRVRGQLWLARGDGSRFPAEFSSANFTDREGNSRTTLTIRDISDRVLAEQLLRETNQRLEAKVAERTRALAAMLEISRDIASQLELGPLLSRIFAALKTVIDYTGAGIAMLEGDEAVILDYTGPGARDRIVGCRIPLARSSGYGQVAQRRAPFVIDDLRAETDERDPLWPFGHETLREEMSYARSWLGVPLMVKDQIIGILRLDHTEPGHFGKDQAEDILTFGYQVAVAITNARWHERAQHSAALVERARLARELHDSVSQSLTAIDMATYSALANWERKPQLAQERVRSASEAAKAAQAEMRALIFELRPDALETDGVINALERHVAVLRERDHLHVETSFDEEPTLPVAIKEALYRIAQEATNNAARHARAKALSVRLGCEGDVVTLVVTDDGVGFDTALAHPGHLGLRSMQERARQIGAAWELESATGQGTRLTVRWGPG